MKSLKNYIHEQLSELKNQRKDILIQRLAYLKYADETKGNNNFKDLYNLLFNFLFDEYGNVRDNKNLYDYIDKLIKDNNGTIPNLPNNGTIETIDKKIKALDELEPSTLKKYIKEVENEASSKEKSQEPNNDDSLVNDMSDDELKEKIGNIIDTEGLTNILGLESSRKMSDDDKQKIKDKEENIKDNIPDNGSDEKESGSESEEDTEKEILKNLTGEETSSEETESGNGEDTNEKEAQEKTNNFFKTGTFESNIQDFNIIIEEQLSEEDRRKNIEQTLIGIKSLANTSSGKRKEKYEKHYKFLKNCTYDENGNFRSIEDAQNYCLKNQKKELGGTFQMIKLAGTLSMTGNEEARKELQDADPDAWKQAEEDFKKDVGSSKSEEEPEEVVVKDKDGSEIHQRSKKNGEGNTYVRIKDGKEIGYASKEDFQKAQQEKAKNESLICVSLVDFITEEEKELSKEEIEQLKKLSKEEIEEILKDLSEEEKKYLLKLIKESIDESVINERHVPLSLKVAMKIRQGVRKIEKKATGRKLNTARKDEEHVVKDVDGSEIHARSKKNQPGTTYVRIKNGKEIGYATKEDYLKAQKNSKK